MPRNPFDIYKVQGPALFSLGRPDRPFDTQGAMLVNGLLTGGGMGDGGDGGGSGAGSGTGSGVGSGSGSGGGTGAGEGTGSGAGLGDGNAPEGGLLDNISAGDVMSPGSDIPESLWDLLFPTITYPGGNQGPGVMDPPPPAPPSSGGGGGGGGGGGDVPTIPEAPWGQVGHEPWQRGSVGGGIPNLPDTSAIFEAIFGSGGNNTPPPAPPPIYNPPPGNDVIGPNGQVNVDLPGGPEIDLGAFEDISPDAVGDMTDEEIDALLEALGVADFAASGAMGQIGYSGWGQFGGGATYDPYGSMGGGTLNPHVTIEGGYGN